MNQKENFRNFLKIYNCYEAYCAALDEQHGYTFDDYVQTPERYIIDHSFTWDDTDEGSEFWNDMNALWSTAVDEGQVFIPNCKSIW